MKEGWKYIPFETSIVKVKKQTSIKSKSYKEEGRFPVISQESSLISGYYDDEKILYRHKKPIIIFGDHTKNIKYIDFDFIVGADGVHILSPIDDINPKFFYYQLLSINLRNLGYARHYKLLKQYSIGVPYFFEQQRIVSFLDAQFAKIDAIKENAEKQLQEAKTLFQNALKDLLTPKEGWKEYNLPTLCKDIFAGGDAPIDKSKEQSNEYLYPIYSNGIENAGLYGYSKSFRVQECALTISARGTIGAVFIRKEPFTPIVRLITLIPNTEIILIDFFYYLLINCNLGNTGSSIPQLTIPNLRELKFHLPSIDAQKVIADKLDSLASKVKKLQSNYSQTITLCEDLKKSLLKDIFS